MNEAILRRITINPDVLAGKPTVRGMRISAEQVLKALGAGVTMQEMLEEYPELEVEDIYAVLLYAANLIAEEKIYRIPA
ncbi:MAG: DUF433 domain-containing protein [Cytophagales bacterium]|jgi:uncharacterized protein (DUF433 family)|nr:DUF433 domain-containing protein [Cytophagales bacterium]